MTDEITRLMRLVEFADSAFPVGTFSFSNGLTSAGGMPTSVNLKNSDSFPTWPLPASR